MKCRRRMTFYMLVAIIVSALCFFAYSYISKKVQSQKVDLEAVAEPREFVTPDVKFDGKYGRTFGDLQEVQIVAAEKTGIVPLTSADSIDILVSGGQLVKVSDCVYYNTDECDFPYLTPLAKELLDEIGKRYHQECGAQQQLRLTGCLRTRESISKLMRRNRNSVPNSCHLYGTTMDISYRFMTQDEKRALAQVLYSLQQGDYCYVKYEYKQPCFHITVRP